MLNFINNLFFLHPGTENFLKYKNTIPTFDVNRILMHFKYSQYATHLVLPTNCVLLKITC